MKFSRMLAVGAATALVGVSTLAIGGTAVADDFYVQDTDFGAVADGDPYLPGWFTGDTGTPAVIASTDSGLSMTGVTQILNGTTPTTGLVSLVDGAQLRVSSGEAIFNIALYGNAAAAGTDTNFTTLIAVNSGQVGLASTSPLAWETTGPIVASDGTPLYAARDRASLTEFQTALGANYEILAFGAYVSVAATVAQITWAGDTHWFLPAEPTATIAPASLTVADFSNSAKGVTGTFSGFVPNEAVTIGLGSPGSGGPIDSATADSDGVVTYKYVSAPADAVVGNYRLTAEGDVSGVFAGVDFVVTANPAVLAATGTDFTPAIVTGGILLLLGTGLVLTGRRRAAAHRS